MKSLPAAVLLSLLTLLCTSCDSKPSAFVNDMVVNRGEPKFRITAVDGKAPVRRKSLFVEVQPLVILAPGAHTLTIQRGFSDPPDEKIYTLDLQAVDKVTYALVSKSGAPALVEAK